MQWHAPTEGPICHGVLSLLIHQLVRSQEPELLIMAGGGGGLNYASFPDTDNQTGWSPMQHFFFMCVLILGTCRALDGKKKTTQKRRRAPIATTTKTQRNIWCFVYCLSGAFGGRFIVLGTWSLNYCFWGVVRSLRFAWILSLGAWSVAFGV